MRGISILKTILIRVSTVSRNFILRTALNLGLHSLINSAKLVFIGFEKLNLRISSYPFSQVIPSTYKDTI